MICTRMLYCIKSLKVINVGRPLHTKKQPLLKNWLSANDVSSLQRVEVWFPPTASSPQTRVAHASKSPPPQHSPLMNADVLNGDRIGVLEYRSAALSVAGRGRVLLSKQCSSNIVLGLFPSLFQALFGQQSCLFFVFVYIHGSFGWGCNVGTELLEINKKRKPEESSWMLVHQNPHRPTP